MSTGQRNGIGFLITGVLLIVLTVLFSEMGVVLRARFPSPYPSREVVISGPLVPEGPVESSPEILPPPEVIPSPRSFPLLQAPTVIAVDPLPLMAPADFSVPAALEEAVDFWRKIYAVYSSNQVVLHDTEDLSIIYEVINLKDLDDFSEIEKEKRREMRVSAAILGLKGRLEDEAADRVRSQTGLKDKFTEAVRISGRYLPLFEEIFVSYGVPHEITRLVFVESMFQERARSRVGAGGLWQFLPGTARRFIKVDRWIDERYDPLVATHAAARLLLKNREEVGSWPLAITSYNTGIGHVKRAVQSVGTTDIGSIVHRYRSDGFGFASRNFYPSFLAAYHVYENRERYLGPIERQPTLEFDQIPLPVSLTFTQVAALSDCTLTEIQSLNPAYDRQVFLEEMRLPVGARIRLPKGRQAVFISRVSQIPLQEGA
ncbi:MAG: lytic transglycosylase domain-containing protein [Deltaproteobacteria bacterium]|nr:lytic transglycosylase domain-containing protein [Deltaproteobacteria bacterium]